MKDASSSLLRQQLCRCLSNTLSCADQLRSLPLIEDWASRSQRLWNLSCLCSQPFASPGAPPRGAQRRKKVRAALVTVGQNQALPGRFRRCLDPKVKHRQPPQVWLSWKLYCAFLQLTVPFLTPLSWKGQQEYRGRCWRDAPRNSWGSQAVRCGTDCLSQHLSLPICAKNLRARRRLGIS